VKSGELEAGLITLPTDTTGLVVRPVMRDENMFVALEGPTTREPMSIERLATIDLIMYDAHFGWRDPTRAQLAARAAAAGVTLSPRIEVEQAESALALASRGFGGTFVLETVARTAAFPPMLKAIPFEPPLYDTFAFVWRKGFRLSPATAELIALARDRMRTFSHAIQLVGDLRMERR
jgi:DNA-binding transcriptional LysR family regulator